MNVLSKPEELGEVVPDTPVRVLSILDLPNEIVEHILEFCGLEELKKLLELKNERLLAAIRSCRTRHFKYWNFDRISEQDLRKFMDEVAIIRGVKVEDFRGARSQADDIVEALVGERPELESFETSYSRCTDKALLLLLSHPRMKVVGLCNSYVTGLMLSSVSNYSAIKQLDLSQCCYLTDDGIMAILNKIGKTLKILNLSYTGVSFSSVDSLANTLPVLEELYLQDCDCLTDAGLMAFLNKSWESLKILDLSGTKVSFSSVDSLANTLPVLEELDLQHCSLLNDDGLITFLNRSGESLKILKLRWTKVSFSSVESLASNLPVLKELCLQDCDCLTNAGLMAFLNKTGESLKILNLSRTRLSFSSVESMTSCLPVLEKLDLSYCSNITEAGLVTFLGKTSGHVELRLQYTTVDVDRIQAAYPHLEIVTGDFPWEN